VFGNRVRGRIFGPKRDEVTGGWTKLLNEELHNLYSLPNIIWMIKSKKTRWARLVARLRAMKNSYKILVENLKERDHSEVLGVDGRIMLK
jgi:hypothetical protein